MAKVIARAGNFELREKSYITDYKPNLHDIEIIYWLPGENHCISVARFDKMSGEIQSVGDRLLRCMDEDFNGGNHYIVAQIRALETIAKNIIALDKESYNGS